MPRNCATSPETTKNLPTGFSLVHDHFDRYQPVVLCFCSRSPEHRSTTAFISSLQDREEVLLSELILVELYRLLRDPAVVTKPLIASEATSVIQIWRRHPSWKITGFPPHSRQLHDRLWKVAAGSAFAFRRILAHEESENNVSLFAGIAPMKCEFRIAEVPHRSSPTRNLPQKFFGL
jgi:hypothetical protein